MEKKVVVEVNLRKMMKKKKVDLVVVLRRKEMEMVELLKFVVGEGGKEMIGVGGDSSPATWPEAGGGLAWASATMEKKKKKKKREEKKDKGERK